MKQRIIALGLALLLTASLAVSALAEEQTEEKKPVTQTEQEAAAAPEGENAPAEETAPEKQPEETGSTPETGGGAGETETEPEPEPPSPAGPDTQEEHPYEPDAVGTISFENLERRIRENNLNVLAIQENIDSIEGMEYDKIEDDLRDSLNSVAGLQWGLIQMGQDKSYTYDKLKESYDAMRKQFDAIRDGELQKDNAGVAWQLRNLQDQIIMAGESLFVTLAELEQQEAGLERQLSALNRTVEEMELRYKLGQISALQLEQTKTGRTALVSGLETLKMNIRTLKTQLELLIGADLTGKITLGPVPAVKTAQTEALDVEADLEKAKKNSYEIYTAEEDLKDAKEDYRDGIKNSAYYMRESVQHTWKAAQLNHDAAIQDYELRFRTLQAQVLDYRQILESSRVSLACQQSLYQAAELKAQQGTLSENKLLDARDELKSAEDAVRQAEIDLFSAYNTYCWAVEHGILN